jgi:hypothetical protein
MPPAGIEPAISASERPQTHTLDRTATGIGIIQNIWKLVVLHWNDVVSSDKIYLQIFWHFFIVISKIDSFFRQFWEGI